MMDLKRFLLFSTFLCMLACQKEDVVDEQLHPPHPTPIGKYTEFVLLNFKDTLSSLIDDSQPIGLQLQLLEQGTVVVSEPDSVKILDSNVHFFIPAKADPYKIVTVMSKESQKAIRLGVSIQPDTETVVLTKTWNPTFGGIGTGVAEDPLLITHLEQFRSIAAKPKLHYLLTTDLNFEAIDNWVPFPVFEGVLNGDFHKLLNFRSVYPNEAVSSGLVHLNEGTIKNLTIKGHHSGAVSLGSIWSGSIAVLNKGVILNCANHCLMGESLYQGGIASTNYGVIRNCSNYGNSTSQLGGIAAVSTQGAVIENCYNHGSSGAAHINSGSRGGIVAYDYLGEGKEALLRNCYNIGSFKGGGVNPVGPIFGKILNTVVENCFYLEGVTSVDSVHSAVIGLTQTQFNIPSTFTNWKFGDTDESPWKMGKSGYPVLYWEE